MGMLALLYWFGFAFVWLFLVVFNRSALDPGGRPDEASAWVDATGYDPNEPESTRPS